MVRIRPVRRDHRRCRLSPFSLAVIVGCLFTGLLALAGGALLDESSVAGDDPIERCIGIQVGSSHTGTTHVHMENVGQAPIGVYVDLIDADGRDSQPVGYRSLLGPGASDDFLFRTPSLGATLHAKPVTSLTGASPIAVLWWVHATRATCTWG